MFLNNSFGKNLDVMHRTMDVSIQRRETIANNIANADTPNFKRSDINFESTLKKALESEKNTGGLQAHRTDERHFQFGEAMDYRDVRPRQVLDYLSQARNDGNNVDIEREINDSLNNQMMYQMLAQTANSHFQRVNIVLK